MRKILIITAVILSYVYFSIILTSLATYKKYGFYGDQCYHIQRAKAIIGMKTEKCNSSIDYPEPLSDSDTYPIGFHYFSAFLLLFIRNEFITFIFVMPLIFLAIPVIIMQIVYLLLRDFNISLFSLLVLNIPQLFNEWAIGGTQYTRYFFILISSLMIYLFILSFRKNKKYLIYALILALFISLFFIHRIPKLAIGNLIYYRYLFFLMPIPLAYMLKKIVDRMSIEQYIFYKKYFSAMFILIYAIVVFISRFAVFLYFVF